MKNIKIFAVLVLVLSFSAFILFYFGEEKNADVKQQTANECQIPTFAKAIGHEDQWLLHNGCPPRKDADKNDKKEK